ncbi:uncharacterized protein LOC124809902 isoform X2 [Hydra vulgaris]|uniref:uncharacterized protein LOC124809902 isoform X2 n=1 Tax=Hydra vulgaris TaxID=6087 RepID=UPI001F5F2067|nr:uncharacterized protein LOC124809902 isoform X2 [Hydra vulgaris]
MMIKKKNYLMKRSLALVFLFLSQIEARVQDRVFYWPFKPFIFINDDNKTDGILPVLYKQLADLCYPNKNLADFILVNETFSQYSFYKSIEKASLDMQSSPNISNTVWFPLFIVPNMAHLSTYNVKSDLFMYSPNIAIITNKEKITVINKIFESIKKCYSIALYSFVLTFIFALLVWFAEYRKNKDFNNFFVKGFGTGLWWASVTVSTVGYGDIAPKSLIGRALSIFWMVIGVLLVSGMTGTFSSVMTTNSFLSIQNQQIAALNDSFDFHIAKKNYNSSLKKEYNSYEEVLQEVHSNKVGYGVINIDALIYTDYKKRYTNVVLVQILNVASQLIIAFGSQTNLMIDIDSIQTVKEVMEDNYIKFSLITVFIIMFIFTIQDAIPFMYNKYKGMHKNKIDDANLPMSFFFNRYLNEEVKSTSKNDMQEELTLIKEQLIRLNNAILSKECCPCLKQQ